MLWAMRFLIFRPLRHPASAPLSWARRFAAAESFGGGAWCDAGNTVIKRIPLLVRPVALPLSVGVSNGVYVCRVMAGGRPCRLHGTLATAMKVRMRR
jgi:hypothetical protein